MADGDRERAMEALDDPTRKVDAHGGYAFGERVRIIEDDEDAGAYEGTEGVLVIEQVGGEEYANVRTHFGFLEDGMSDPVEVSPENVEPV